MRTGLAALALGLAIAKLIPFQSSSDAAKIFGQVSGVIIIVFGCLSFLYGLFRIHVIVYNLERGFFTIDLGTPAIIAVVAIIFGGILITILFL